MLKKKVPFRHYKTVPPIWFSLSLHLTNPSLCRGHNMRCCRKTKTQEAYSVAQDLKVFTTLLDIHDVEELTRSRGVLYIVVCVC